MNLKDLFEEAIRQSASDIHLATGEIPRLRVAGTLVPFGEPLDLPALLADFLTPDGVARLNVGLSYENTVFHGDLAFVGIVFRVGQSGFGATFRMLPKLIPGLDVIAEGAPELFRRLVETRRGLVIVAGPTGSGKWTTASSMVETINQEKADRIFVVAAHPSFLFESKKSLVTQLHVGLDCESYVRALEIAMHADLDVVAMDDIPTFETLRQALIAADTGHLVIANLNAATPVEAIQRLLDSAGEEEPALRKALAKNLVAVTAQRLLPGAERGRAPAYEWIVNTPAIRAALIDGDLAETQVADPECRTLDAALDILVSSGRVTEETASVHRN